tara:strand:- start:42 stop:341 length:300 start_codon:yes stop_codon:yes gene_type:complete
MMVIPMDARVVIKKPTRQEQTASGIILPDTVDEGKQTEQGEVLAVGPGMRSMVSGEIIPMNVNVGDKIIYTKYSGTEVVHEGEELFIVMEKDIIAKVEG